MTGGGSPHGRRRQRSAAHQLILRPPGRLASRASPAGGARRRATCARARAASATRGCRPRSSPRRSAPVHATDGDPRHLPPAAAVRAGHDPAADDAIALADLVHNPNLEIVEQRAVEPRRPADPLVTVQVHGVDVIDEIGRVAVPRQFMSPRARTCSRALRATAESAPLMQAAGPPRRGRAGRRR